MIDGEPEDPYIRFAVQQAVNVAASVWTIAYAAAIAQSLRALALFRGEQGIIAFSKQGSAPLKS